MASSGGKRKANFSGEDEVREYDKTKRPKAVSSMEEEEEEEEGGEPAPTGGGGELRWAAERFGLLLLW